MSEKPNLVGPDYLAKLLCRSVNTIRVDASRRPESLPPRLVIPGTRNLLWVEADVLDWLNALRPQVKRKAGRPVSPTYLQSQMPSGCSNV